MRSAALGMSMAVLAGVSLAACGDQPEPIAPVGPSFDRTTESTDSDEADPMVPNTATDAVPPVGSEPGEIPEVMEDDTYGDTTTGVLGEPEQPVEDPADEPGTPQ